MSGTRKKFLLISSITIFLYQFASIWVLPESKWEVGERLEPICKWARRHRTVIVTRYPVFLYSSTSLSYFLRRTSVGYAVQYHWCTINITVTHPIRVSPILSFYCNMVYLIVSLLCINKSTILTQPLGHGGVTTVGNTRFIHGDATASGGRCVYSSLSCDTSLAFYCM